MINKTIHYIWLGGKPKSKLGNICINSWYERLPGYQIIEWNNENLDLETLCDRNKFLSECRERKLWAFMADYLRLYVLYHHGGIYLDLDIQVIKSFDELLAQKMFIGYEYLTREKKGAVTQGTGVIGAEQFNPIIKRCLDFYNDLIWITDIYYIPSIFTYILKTVNAEDYTIYPVDFFAPYDYRRDFDRSCITKNTYAIHWFEGSWHDNLQIRLFLETKHIKNPVKRLIVQLRKAAGYYYHKMFRVKYKYV